MPAARPVVSPILALALIAAPPVAAQSADFSVAARVGTLGIGVEAAKLLTDHLGVRVAGYRFSYSTTRVESDISYDAELKLKGFTALADFFPSSRGSFHLTGGLMTDPAEASGVGQPTGDTFDINGTTYTAQEVGTVTARATWPSTMPYAGLGWGTPASRGGGVSFAFDLGVGFGKPTVDLSASSAVPGSMLAADVEAEERDLEDDIDKYGKLYPVISLGLMIRF